MNDIKDHAVHGFANSENLYLIAYDGVYTQRIKFRQYKTRYELRAYYVGSIAQI